MGILGFFKGLINKEEKSDNLTENKNEVQELPIDEEDRLVVALAASIMAGKDKQNSNFHISKIRRIK